VHYWADLQSVHGMRCYDNIAPNAKCQQVLCTRSMPWFTYFLHGHLRRTAQDETHRSHYDVVLRLIMHNLYTTTNKYDLDQMYDLLQTQLSRKFQKFWKLDKLQTSWRQVGDMHDKSLTSYGEVAS